MIRSCLCRIMLLMAVPTGAAISQSAPAQVHTLTLRVDNDAFDFWMYPWNRPDEEYTSGVHVSYDGGDAPGWTRAHLSGHAPCAVGLTDCRTGGVEIGQDIYSPAVSHLNPHAGPGSRPNAGWLFAAEHARLLDNDRSRELTVTLGVTGPPSLGQVTQRFIHSLAPKYNRPVDWTKQLNFEPGIIATYEERRRSVLSEGKALGVDLIPRASVSAGNVITQAEAGFQTRIGWNLSHPWLPQTHGAEFGLTAGLWADAVARNLFLDGNTFSSSPRVSRRDFVGSGELALSFRYHRLTLSYRAVNQTQSYVGGPKWHPWASMVGGLTLER